MTVKRETQALVALEGDVQLVSELLNLSTVEIWDRVLSDTEAPPYLKNALLFQMLEILNDVKTRMLAKLDEMDGPALFRAWNQILDGMIELTRTIPGVMQQQNNFFTSPDEFAAYKSSMEEKISRYKVPVPVHLVENDEPSNVNSAAS